MVTETDHDGLLNLLRIRNILPVALQCSFQAVRVTALDGIRIWMNGGLIVMNLAAHDAADGVTEFRIRNRGLTIAAGCKESNKKQGKIK